jgi:hypothetical protein
MSGEKKKKKFHKFQNFAKINANTWVLGTSKDRGVMFWQINKMLQVQKVKICYYDNQGKRTNKFRVPFKNDDGYRSCLFGEHLLITKYRHSQMVVLVESEKTAVVGSIMIPKYTWLSYGGLNGLTMSKIEALRGFKKILIIPDFSSCAINVISKKISEAKVIGIDIKLWQITDGITDTTLKELNIYNDDIEDIFRGENSATYRDIVKKPP